MDEYLKKAFKQLEDVRNTKQARLGIVPFLKTKGGHTWAEGYFEPLRSDFTSSGMEQMENKKEKEL